MAFLSDLRILYHLALRPVRGATHAERLENFYGGQAADYDEFRKRLLHGRAEMFRALPLDPGATWVDLGGGTGANLEWVAERVPALEQVYLVDLAPSLLAVARQRAAQRGWSHVEAVEADATSWLPPGGEGTVDVVTFSYALTMIPDWFAAMNHARRLLKPGGAIGVVDFHVGRKFAEAPRARHGWWTRHLWSAWFATDNVFLSPDHLPYLATLFEPMEIVESRAPVPYVPLGRVPYYRFIGRKG